MYTPTEIEQMIKEQKDSGYIRHGFILTKRTKVESFMAYLDEREIEYEIRVSAKKRNSLNETAYRITFEVEEDAICETQHTNT